MSWSKNITFREIDKILRDLDSKEINRFLDTPISELPDTNTSEISRLLENIQAINMKNIKGKREIVPEFTVKYHTKPEDGAELDADSDSDSDAHIFAILRNIDNNRFHDTPISELTDTDTSDIVPTATSKNHTQPEDGAKLDADSNAELDAADISAILSSDSNKVHVTPISELTDTDTLKPSIQTKTFKKIVNKKQLPQVKFVEVKPENSAPNLYEILPLEEFLSKNKKNEKQKSELLPQYPCYRNVRGDGNCFYRAVAVGALEFGIRSGDKEFLDKLYTTIRNTSLTSSQLHGYKEKCLKFVESVSNEVKNLPSCKNNTFKTQSEELSQKTCQRLLDDDCDIPLVATFRALGSCYVRRNPDEFYYDTAGASSSGNNEHRKGLATTSDQLAGWLDKWGEDAQQSEMLAVRKAISIPVLVVQLVEKHSVSYTYLCENEKTYPVHIMLNTGHYYLLYTKKLMDGCKTKQEKKKKSQN